MKLKNKTSLLFLFVSVFLIIENSFANDLDWNGDWTYPSRYYSGTLQIKNQTATQFDFELFSLNGANMGEISGIAKIKGNTAVFDDRLNNSADFESYGCIVTFTNKGDQIDIKTNDKCRSYAGNAVYFDKEYKKGKDLPYIEQNLVQRNVFDNAKMDENFKKLTNKHYETFLNAFHLVYQNEDSKVLNTKVFSGCVRGVCPWVTGIIMFDNSGNIYAMVFDSPENSTEDSLITTAYYYSNNKDYTEKLPATIKEWFDNKMGDGDKFEIVYKNKP